MDDILMRCLRHPEEMPALAPRAWETLIGQARSSLLLGHLQGLLAKGGYLKDLPRQVRRHLEAERRIVDVQHEAVLREAGHIRTALAELGAEPIFLKGAAYVLADLPIAAGRRFADVDILLPRPLLGKAESLLALHGWSMGEITDYDQAYFRRWMHELPPLEHPLRGTVLDVHHNLLPATGRLHPSSQRLLDCALPLAGWPGCRVLAPADMVLHSACHLFQEGELERGLRDLVDLAGLLQHFGREPAFWSGLLPRARELDLLRPLYYALRYLRLLLDFRCPPEFEQALEESRPPGAVLILMDAIFSRVLRPHHASACDRWSRLARLAAYIRAHWLRMPPLLLASHLARKAVARALDQRADR